MYCVPVIKVHVSKGRVVAAASPVQNRRPAGESGELISER